jgi:hypothetical protein
MYKFSKQTKASILRISHISFYTPFKGAFTPNVKSVLSENLGGILGGTQFCTWVLFFKIHFCNKRL